MSCTGKTRAAPSGARIRSLGGCLTCRTRKVKCDETHPACRQCRRSGLGCGGYEAKLRFVHYSPDGLGPPDDRSQNDSGHSRRILFSEPERAAMSRRMQHTISEDQVDQVLRTLDMGPEGQVCELPPQYPFAIFRADGTGTPATSGQPVVSPVAMHDQAALATQHTVYPQATDSSSPGLSASNLTSLDDILTGIDEDQTGIDEDQGLSLDLSSVPMLPCSPPTSLPRLAASPSPLDLHVSYGVDESFTTLASTHAQFLLEHYKSQTEKLFSPLRVRKSPWSILHLPRALSALAELTIFKKTAKHAHSSLFYSVLAVSALNWDNINREQKNSTTYWRSIGEVFSHEAKKELQWTCETELFGVKSSKYKDILMAILTMVTISVVTGQHEEARSYLLNTELFIGFRGAPKLKKSKKVKLLHSIYLFLRVIEESTYMYPWEKQLYAGPSPSSQGMLFPSLRTHSLRHGRDLDEFVGIDYEFGLFGRLDEPTNPAFFENIYGFPQELLSFISRTTFLANEIAALRFRSPESAMNAELENLSTRLETELCAWQCHGGSSVGDADDPVSAFANRAIMAHLISAFHSAAIIFFYRRVRELNSLLLQPYVEKVFRSLEEFKQEQRKFSLVNCGIVWPGFIAGTEALDPALQARFHEHLQDCAKSSGMRNFEFAATLLKDLWSARLDIGNENMTWMDLIRDRQLSLVLT